MDEFVAEYCSSPVVALSGDWGFAPSKFPILYNIRTSLFCSTCSKIHHRSFIYKLDI